MEEVIALLPDLEGDLDIAWRLAYVVLADESAAATAARQAFAHTVGSELGDDSDRIRLFATTMRLVADRAADGPEADRPLVSAFWRLPGEQRAGLWLSAVEGLDDGEIAEVLDVSQAAASQAISDAKDWLEVVIEGTSGPLCPEEANLVEYMQGDMSRSDILRLDRHIRTCPTCKSRVDAFEEFAGMKDVLRNALPDAPETLTTGALEESTQDTDFPVIDLDDGDRLTFPSPVRWLAACCAGLLILGLIGVSIIHRSSASSGKAPAAPPPSVSTTLPAAGPATTAPSTASTPAPPVTFPTAP